MFKRESHFWWELICSILGESLARILTWKQFKTKFTKDYCSSQDIKQTDEDFMHLQQGVKSIQTYTVEYNEKLRFARHQVDTKERKIDRYLWRLRNQIWEFLQTSTITTFLQAV